MTWWQPPRPPPLNIPLPPPPTAWGWGRGPRGLHHTGRVLWLGHLAEGVNQRRGRGGVGTPGWDIGREWVLGTTPRDPAFGVGGEPMP